MIESVLDAPIWEDCPFRDQIPPEIEIRLHDGIVYFWWPKFEIFVQTISDCVEDNLAHILNSLTGAAFEKEWPGVYMELIKAGVKASLGEPFPAELVPAKSRFDEINKLKALIR